MLGRSVTFGPKSVEKRPQQENFFELTTPNVYPPDDNFNHALFCLIVMSQSLPDIRFAKMPFYHSK